MAKKIKKHGNVGKRRALTGDYSAELKVRLNKKQDEYLDSKVAKLKSSRSSVVRQLIDDDMKQDKNK